MRRKTTSRSTLPYWLLAFAGVSAIVAMVYLAVTEEDKPQLNALTRCPVDTEKYPVSRKTVVLIDRTESLNEVQQLDVLNTLERELAIAPREEIVLYELLGSSDVRAKPVLQLCNPVQPVPNSFAAKLDRDVALEAKEFNEKFLQHVRQTVKSALDTQGTADSPIMELIQASSVRDLKTARYTSGRRLIVISDLMQYSHAFSQYGRPVDSAFFKTPTFQSLRVDLTGVDVLVLYIKRPTGASAQPKDHRGFWQQYFSLQGARVAFIDIEGAAWSAHKAK